MVKPFQILRYEILGLSVELNESFDVKAKETTGDIATSMRLAPHKSDARRWTIELQVNIKPVKGSESAFFPYSVSVKARGYCAFKDKVSKDDAEKTLRLNGASILYGLMRAQVAQITAQSTHGQFLLPVLNFVEMEAQRLNGQDKEKKAPSEVPGK